MKKAVKNQPDVRDLNLTTINLSENLILNESAMQSLRGGDGDGGQDIILYPPKPPKEGEN